MSDIKTKRHHRRTRGALIPLFVWALRMPFTVLCAIVMVLCIVGGFAPSQKMHDVWLIAGFGYSAVLTPTGRLLKRSAHAEDRPAVFAAQFALSHACWLVTYPLSGWLMTQLGAIPALVTLAALAAVANLPIREAKPQAQLAPT